MKFEWADNVYEHLFAAEQAESALSYVSECGSEKARKLLGSYYTPIDVARFFWVEFFVNAGIDDLASAQAYLDAHHFVEPSVGAGALFFALLERLLQIGLTPNDLSIIRADLVDLNDQALGFVRTSIASLEKTWDIKFKNINFVNSDFRIFCPDHADRPIVFFGNPPFVSNVPGTSKWKNLFADFLEIALQKSNDDGTAQFILPLSITFSRDYRELRKKLRNCERTIVLSNFDNIPDTLFKSGKPLHSNTNKANSQRCSILGVFPSERQQVLSTCLHRWPKAERAAIFSASPRYFDITDYDFDDQFPRPIDDRILIYLNISRGGKRLNDLINRDGQYRLYVAGVARNYIGIRETCGAGVHNLGFVEHNDFCLTFRILSSDLFLDYWLSVGDGFHVTKANLLDFPIHPILENRLRSCNQSAETVWQKRSQYEKYKLNSGREMRSFDFSKAFDSLYMSQIF